MAAAPRSFRSLSSVRASTTSRTTTGETHDHDVSGVRQAGRSSPSFSLLFSLSRKPFLSMILFSPFFFSQPRSFLLSYPGYTSLSFQPIFCSYVCLALSFFLSSPSSLSPPFSHSTQSLSFEKLTYSQFMGTGINPPYLSCVPWGCPCLPPPMLPGEVNRSACVPLALAEC